MAKSVVSKSAQPPIMLSFSAGAAVNTIRSCALNPICPGTVEPWNCDWNVMTDPAVAGRVSEVKVIAEVCPNAAWSAKMLLVPARTLTTPAVSEKLAAEASLEKASVPPRMLIGTASGRRLRLLAVLLLVRRRMPSSERLMALVAVSPPTLFPASSSVPLSVSLGDPRSTLPRTVVAPV